MPQRPGINERSVDHVTIICADIETTRKYLHFAPRPDDAALVAAAFALEFPEATDRVAS